MSAWTLPQPRLGHRICRWSRKRVAGVRAKPLRAHRVGQACKECIAAANFVRLPSYMAETMTRQRNWAAWFGLLFAVAAVLFNASFFFGPPAPKLIVWLGVVLTIAAVVCAVIGVMRAFSQPQVYRGKVSSSILGVVSLLLCGLVAVASISSRALPVATNAPQVGQKVPDFTLADTSGNKVSLNQLLGKAGSAAVPANANVTAKVKEILDSTPANELPSLVRPVETPMPTKAVLLVFYRGYW